MKATNSLVYEAKWYARAVAANRRSPEELKGKYVLELHFYRLGCLLFKDFPKNPQFAASPEDVATCGQDISHRAVYMYPAVPPTPERINSLWFHQNAPDNTVDDRW